jgi:transcriptional regulator of acetoin/glycerol metabolism
MNKRGLTNVRWHLFARRRVFWDEFNMLYCYTRIYNWTVRKTAKDLHIPKSTLHDRLKKHGLVFRGGPRKT